MFWKKHLIRIIYTTETYIPILNLHNLNLNLILTALHRRQKKIEREKNKQDCKISCKIRHIHKVIQMITTYLTTLKTHMTHMKDHRGIKLTTHMKDHRGNGITHNITVID